MPKDFTHDMSDSSKHFPRVEKQQGQAQLDADADVQANKDADIIKKSYEQLIQQIFNAFGTMPLLENLHKIRFSRLKQNFETLSREHVKHEIARLACCLPNSWCPRPSDYSSGFAEYTPTRQVKSKRIMFAPTRLRF